MAEHKIAYVARVKPNRDLVEEQLVGLDHEMHVHICNSNGETIEAVKDVDVILNYGVPMPREVIRQIDRAQAIVNFGHGFDRIDDHAATDQGVMVVNGAGFCSEEVSNHVIMLLLACAKKLMPLNSLVKAGNWEPKARARVLLPMPPIQGLALGLVGFGNTARATARKAFAFGLDVLTYDPYVPPWIADDYGVELVPDPDTLARRSDFVSMHVPLNDETRHMVGEAFFRAMKPTAYFINICRGPTVDEKAIVKALQDGEIAGAGLDVFEQEPTPASNPLLKMDNVIVTPHSAGTSDVSLVAGQVRMGQEAARILRGTLPMSLANPAVLAKIPVRPTAVNV